MGLFHRSNKLGRNAKLLLTVSLLFALAAALSNTFVNVFLWKIKAEYAVIGMYNFFNYMMVPFAFLLGGKLAKQYSRMIPLRVGILLLTLFYLTVLIMGKKVVDYIIPLGLTLGFGSGLFWLAFNVLYIEVTSPENRDKFNGLNGFLTSGAGIIAPIISGFIIVRSGGIFGYRIIFAVSLGIFFVAILISLFMKKRKATGRLHMKGVFATCFRFRTQWGRMSVALLFQGIREGIFFFFIGLLVFVVTNNELKLGTFGTICSITSLVSYLITGKILKPFWRRRFIWIGASGLFLVMIPLLFDINYMTLFILGIGISLFFPIYITPFTSVVFDLIGKDEKRGKLRIEYIIARETMLNFGRLLSAGSFILLVTFTSDMGVIKWFAMGVGMSQILAAIFVPKTKYVPEERHATLFQVSKMR